MTAQESHPAAFGFGLALGLAIAAAGAAAVGVRVRTQYAEPPFNPAEHIELTTPAGDRCRLSGPGRFDVLDAAYPFTTEPTR